MRRLAPAFVLCLASTVLAQPAWKPAPTPLSTQWAAQVEPAHPLPEYPRPQMTREKWQNLNGPWQFAPAKEGEEPPFKKDLTRQLLVPFPVESSLSGVGEHHERLWYRRTFSLPADWKSSRVILHFGAVDWQSDIYVNGKRLLTHKGGYDAFEVDITPALITDTPDAIQELVVGVYDPTDAGTQPRGKQVTKPEGIWYTPCTGIWQTVWLEPLPKHAIRKVILKPDASAKSVRVTAVVDEDTPKDMLITARVYGGGLVSGRPNTEITIPCPGGKLWSPEDPNLYDLYVNLVESNKPLDDNPVDSVKSYFGLRSVAVKKDDKGVTRIHLNNKPCFMVGPLDQGFWPDGIYTAPTDEALKYDIEMTRKLGFNMCRKHVKVEPARWYYWADRLGLIVWQDMPSGDKYIGPGDLDITRSPESVAQYETELKAMIDSHFNSPSIVMWVVFNEGWGQFDTARIVELTKQLDPSRLVDGASGWADRNCADVHDVHIYPGPGSPDPEPKRAAVLGEFGGLGLGVDNHTWAANHWGYQGTASQADLTDKYVGLLRRAWKFNEKPGLSAAVYTQTTDVETECNGLMTYDRAILKVDAAKVAAANRGNFPTLVTLVPTAEDFAAGQGPKWHFTTEKPAPGWETASFSDSHWREAPAGFGTEGTPGAHVGTTWNSDEIWLRRTFDLPGGTNLAMLKESLRLLVHHDEDVEVYINGVKALAEKGYTADYETFPVTPEGAAAIKPSGNVLALYCRQTNGGQFIDVGLAREVPTVARK